METIRDQGRHQAGDKGGRASDLKREGNYFSKIKPEIDKTKNPRHDIPHRVVTTMSLKVT